MKIYSLYHEPTGQTLYFKHNPTHLSSVAVANLWLKCRDEYFETAYEKFMEDFINNDIQQEHKFEELERLHRQKLKKLFFSWLSTISFKKLCKMESIHVDKIEVIE